MRGTLAMILHTYTHIHNKCFMYENLYIFLFQQNVFAMCFCNRNETKRKIPECNVLFSCIRQRTTNLLELLAKFIFIKAKKYIDRVLSKL